VCTKWEEGDNMGRVGERNIGKGVEYVGRGWRRRPEFKVHYARRCGNFNLQKEGGNKVERRTSITNGDDGAKKIQKKGGETVEE
jgi:hypothetical protein